MGMRHSIGTKFSILAAIFLSVAATSVLGAVSHLAKRDTAELTDWVFIKGRQKQAQYPGTSEAGWEKVTVPHSYSMDALTDTGYYRGTAWYRTVFTAPESWKGQRVYAYFEAVGHTTSVYINGKRVGSHSGGYSAFCVELTSAFSWDEPNLLAVNCDNGPSAKRIPTDDNLFNVYGGIYRPVTLFTTPNCNISPTHSASSGLLLRTTDIQTDKATVQAELHIDNKGKAAAATVDATISGPNNEEIVKQTWTLELLSGSQTQTLDFTVPAPILWQARINPAMYTLSISLNQDDTTDVVEQQFGIREFSVDPNKGFILNGKPYRLYGVCRHQEWKQYGPALSDVQHNADMDAIVEVGATALRLAHYQQSATMYRRSDEDGVVVWAEIPYVHDWTGRENRNAKQQLKELILQNYNHPSICFWGLWNEVRASSTNSPCVVLTKELQDLAKKLDPTRLTTSASDRSATAPMSGISDLQAWNKYYGWYYGKTGDMAKWLDKSHAKYPDLPLGISEYGVGGNIYQQDPAKLEKPSGRFFPEQAQTIYHEKSWAILKDRPYVWGSFIWNMFDFSVNRWNRGGINNLNHKGLVTFDRQTRKDSFYFYKANWSDLPVVHIAEGRNDQRSEAVTQVKIYSNLQEVTLLVNGTEIAKQDVNSDSHINIFPDVQLQAGLNSIDAIARKGESVITHHVQWRLNEEK